MSNSNNQLPKDNNRRLESDINELINENKSLKKQIVNLLSQVDYERRKVDDRLQEVLEREKEIPQIIELAKKEANVIINKAYMNADLIVEETLSSSLEVLKELQLAPNSSFDLKKRIYHSMQELEETLEGLKIDEVKNLILFNKDHDKFFKK